MFRKITFIALILAFCTIVLGSYVRLTDAGLGCPDWPGCYGQALLNDSDQFEQQAKQAFPDKPLDMLKAWKEMTHRYVAAALGFCVLILALISWREKHCRGAAVGTSLALLVLVALQAVLGMWSVTMQNMPIIVTAHLLLGIITFRLLFWTYLRVKPGITVRQTRAGPAFLTSFATLVLLAQIFLGGWVSTNYAALACIDFPQCNGQWWPQADYPAALNVLHGLWSGDTGILAAGGRIAAYWLHWIGALVTLLVLGLVCVRAIGANRPLPVRKGGILLCVFLLLQIISGLAIVRLGLPLWGAVAHSGFSALLVLPLVYIGFYSRYQVLEKQPVAEVAGEAHEAQQLQPEMPSGREGLVLEPIDQISLQGIPGGAVAEEIFIEKSPETLFLRLKSQLKKTRSGLSNVLSGVALGKRKIDEQLLEEIEASLIMADVGIEATNDIINHLTENVERHQLNDPQALSDALKKYLLDLLQPCEEKLEIPNSDAPFVILVVGVNGAGKTTTIGKMAKRLQAQGHSVMLAAGDTFRAAAVEQLQTWGERNHIHVVAQHTGADSASVIYDGVQSAKAKGIDVLIADTAGRLHTKSNLMDELKKVKRIIGKLDSSAPHEVLLVLDSGTGQNALSQAKQFNDTVQLTGIALTKLDGTAKGGVIFALARQFGVPIRYIGIGEGIDDLQDFHAQQFVDALFVND